MVEPSGDQQPQPPENANGSGSGSTHELLPLPAFGSETEQHEFTEQEIGGYAPTDPYLPIANVARLMKNALPSNAKISKDAKEIVQECVSEFISFITSEAAEKCLLDKRKTVGGEDIIYAMTSLGFTDYATVMRVHLAKLREHTIAAAAARAGAQATANEAAEALEDEDDEDNVTTR